MWTIVQEILLWAVGLTIISQIILPALVPSFKYFWLFKKGWMNQSSEDKPEAGDLHNKYESLKKDVTEVKEKVSDLREEVNDEFRRTGNLKKKSDKLI